jgi:hypothetical protein
MKGSIILQSQVQAGAALASGLTTPAAFSGNEPEPGESCTVFGCRQEQCMPDRHHHNGIEHDSDGIELFREALKEVLMRIG